MIIRTQNRKEIVDVMAVSISKELGVKRFYLIGKYKYSPILSAGETTLGIYPSEERALEELDRIMLFFQEKPLGIYQMTE